MTATEARYFDEQWDRAADPWDQIARFSEQRKFDLTVASLPRQNYRRAFEPGCGTGSLTTRLARRADVLIAGDRHARAVDEAALRCRSLPNVSVGLCQLPHDWPDGVFDLIVLSEILYYFDGPVIDQILTATRSSLEPSGHLVACHFRPEVPQHAVRGDTVHERIRSAGWRTIVAHRENSFVLEVFEAPSGGSDR